MGAAPSTSSGRDVSWSRRGRRARHRYTRGAQEPGTPCSLHDLCPAREPEYQALAPGPRRDRRERNFRRTSWYRQAKHNEARRDGDRDSERLVVPVKPGNPTRGDPVEGSRRRVAEPLEGNMADASKSGTVCTKQQRIAELAQQAPPLGFTSLNHYLDLTWLGEAYQRTRTDGAGGVDGQTGEDYAD